MYRFSVTEAKARLTQLIQKALDGEDVIIVKDNQPLIKLTPVKHLVRRRCPGSAKGQVTMSRDFGKGLEDLKDYR